MARSTLPRVSSATPGKPFSTRDTVITETPASEATSAMTARWTVATSGGPVVEPVERGCAINRIEADGAPQKAPRDLGREVTTVEFGQHVGRAAPVLVAQGDRV